MSLQCEQYFFHCHHCRHSSHRNHFRCYSVTTEWRGCIGCLKLQVSFHKRATNYRALWWKQTYADKTSCAISPPCTTVVTISAIIVVQTLAGSLVSLQCHLAPSLGFQGPLQFYLLMHRARALSSSPALSVCVRESVCMCVRVWEGESERIGVWVCICVTVLIRLVRFRVWGGYD